MKRLIAILAMALVGAGCATYSPYGSVGYGRVYQSYGYGYGGYPVYGYSYPIHRYGEYRSTGRRHGDREHWHGHRDGQRYRARPGHRHEHGNWHRRGGPTPARTHRWRSLSREHASPARSGHHAWPRRHDVRRGAARPRGYHHGSRQR